MYMLWTLSISGFHSLISSQHSQTVLCTTLCALQERRGSVHSQSSMLHILACMCVCVRLYIIAHVPLMPAPHNVAIHGRTAYIGCTSTVPTIRTWGMRGSRLHGMHMYPSSHVHHEGTYCGLKVPRWQDIAVMPLVRLRLPSTHAILHRSMHLQCCTRCTC